MGERILTETLMTTFILGRRIWASLMAQWQRNCLQESGIQFPGQEDPLEKEMATHSNILAWEIPWTEEPDGLHST